MKLLNQGCHLTVCAIGAISRPKNYTCTTESVSELTVTCTGKSVQSGEGPIIFLQKHSMFC